MLNVRITATMSALVVLLALTGCSSDVVGDEATPVTTSSAAPTSSTADCETLEGCFTREQMADLASEMVPLLRDFAAAAARELPEPKAYELIKDGRTRNTDCGKMDDTEFAYCPSDEVVYLGQSTLWEFYHDIGDAAAVLALGHEWGHHLQNLAGAPLDDDDQATSIEIENQADCVGGAFQQHLIERDVFEPDDVDDVEGLLRSIAESESDPERTHGTLQERTEAWQSGIDGGLDACNSFFADTPLVS